MIRQQMSATGAALSSPMTLHMGPEMQDHIGRQLQAVYNEILEESVPERFIALLADLERRTTEKL